MKILREEKRDERCRNLKYILTLKRRESANRGIW